jgi:two-component system sensor histidine kinase YesM
MRALPFVQRYTVLISALLAMTIPLLLLLTRRIVAQPLGRLSAAMRRLHSGDFTFRLPSGKDSAEIELVNETFNSMAGQIQGLKIDIYERELMLQRSHLLNLKQQLRPHFLINSMNIIHSLLQTGEHDLARKLILHSTEYLRYLIKIDDDLVPLNDEIRHVETYLQIQQIRYPNRITYDITVDRLVSDMLIPPALLQNLVENSIKYAMRMDEHLHITVTVTAFEIEFYPYARIIVTDNGAGFPPDILPALNKGMEISETDSTHIGIQNSFRRLNLLFGNKSSLRLYNTDGAVCEITFPARFADEDSTD